MSFAIDLKFYSIMLRENTTPFQLLEIVGVGLGAKIPSLLVHGPWAPGGADCPLCVQRPFVLGEGVVGWHLCSWDRSLHHFLPG